MYLNPVQMMSTTRAQVSPGAYAVPPQPPVDSKSNRPEAGGAVQRLRRVNKIRAGGAFLFKFLRLSQLSRSSLSISSASQPDGR